MAQMMRTSTGSSCVAPTLRTFFSWIARSSFTCIGAAGRPTSSRKSVPPLRRLEESVAIVVRAGEGALLVAEELALHQVLGNRAAVDRDERRSRARAALVDQARGEFLAAARFAGDVDRRLRARELADQSRAPGRAARLAPRQPPCVAVARGASPRSGSESAERTSARSCSSSTGLATIVEGARLQRRDRVLGAAVGGDHRHRRCRPRARRCGARDRGPSPSGRRMSVRHRS